jgi:hypothetical protein
MLIEKDEAEFAQGIRWGKRSAPISPGDRKPRLEKLDQENVSGARDRDEAITDQAPSRPCRPYRHPQIPPVDIRNILERASARDPSRAPRSALLQATPRPIRDQDHGIYPLARQRRGREPAAYEEIYACRSRRSGRDKCAEGRMIS